VFNLSGSELVFLVLIALVVLGPDKLPEAMRKAGKAYADFKRMTSGFQSEMKSVLDEPLRELRETAEMAKQAASFDINPLSKTPDKPTNNITNNVTTNNITTGINSGVDSHPHQTGVGPTDRTATQATPVVAAAPAAPATDTGAPPMQSDATTRRLAAAAEPAPADEVAAE
jgi:sec-independent protein translocase protein TatB